LRLNKPCELEDFEQTEVIELIRAIEPELTELYPDYPHGREHRKSWEYQQIIRGAERLGAIHEHAEVLCVPAGHERTVYELSNRVRRVTAADIYGDVFTGQCDPFLIDPSHFAKQPHSAARLIPRHMDPRFLRCESNSFDLVVSPNFSSFPMIEEGAGTVLLEFERVLLPGGILVLCVELAVDGLGAVTSGTQIYDDAQVRRLLSCCSNLELVEPIQGSVTDRTLATKMLLSEATEDSQKGVSRFPHIVLEENGRQFTTTTVFLRKSGG
jgi:hypothetical protein